MRLTPDSTKRLTNSSATVCSRCISVTTCRLALASGLTASFGRPDSSVDDQQSSLPRPLRFFLDVVPLFLAAQRAFITAEIRLRSAALMTRRLVPANPFGGRPRRGTLRIVPSSIVNDLPSKAFTSTYATSELLKRHYYFLSRTDLVQGATYAPQISGPHQRLNLDITVKK